MTSDQAVQYSYMAPNAFKSLSSFNLKLLITKTKKTLIELDHDCPQSQKKDRTIYQYKHALNVMKRYIE